MPSASRMSFHISTAARHLTALQNSVWWKTTLAYYRKPSPGIRMVELNCHHQWVQKEIYLYFISWKWSSSEYFEIKSVKFEFVTTEINKTKNSKILRRVIKEQQILFVNNITCKTIWLKINRIIVLGLFEVLFLSVSEVLFL